MLVVHRQYSFLIRYMCDVHSDYFSDSSGLFCGDIAELSSQSRSVVGISHSTDKLMDTFLRSSILHNI